MKARITNGVLKCGGIIMECACACYKHIPIHILFRFQPMDFYHC